MSRDHVAGDKVTTPEEVRHSQTVLSTTAKALGNAMNLGVHQSQAAYRRCLDNLGSSASDVPTLKLLVKVHKPLTPDGHPQSRPVVAAASGLSSRVGDMVADILEPLVVAQTPRMEDQSTEEVLAQLEEAEQAIRDAGLDNTVVGSLDVRALYPSLDQRGSAEAVETFIMNSQVDVKGVDYRAVQVYLASNLSEKEVKREGLVKLLPRRTWKMGVRPGSTTTELGKKKGPEPGPELKSCASGRPDSKWSHTDTTILTEEDKKKLFSKMIKVAVLCVFKNHMYQFGGLLYRQLRGEALL